MKHSDNLYAFFKKDFYTIKTEMLNVVEGTLSVLNRGHAMIKSIKC